VELGPTELFARSWIDSAMCHLEIDVNKAVDRSSIVAAGIREIIEPVFRGKPIKRVEVFGSAACGEMSPDSDVDILVTPTREATRHDLFIMAAQVEEALGRPVDFLIRSDVEAMKNVEAKNLILRNAVTVYVP
jgi:predicted nucleotidyltransferase